MYTEPWKCTCGETHPNEFDFHTPADDPLCPLIWHHPADLPVPQLPRS